MIAGRRWPLPPMKLVRPIAFLAFIFSRGDGFESLPTPMADLASESKDAEDRPGPDGLTDRQRRGKKIYLDGSSGRGDAITASLGQSPDAVPGAFLACGNCHGRDGQGRSEGGIDPPGLAWRTLVRPRVDQGQGRRERPPYNSASLGRVITMGIDPSGDHLGVGMPRYRLSTRDLDDLIDYLRVLGTEATPGVFPETIRIGTILPASPEAVGMRTTIAETLRAAVADLNERGGIYQRRIELETADLADSSNLASFLIGRPMFALVAPYIAGHEEEVDRVFRREGVPVIGPFSSIGPTADPPDRGTFFIEPGLTAQALALVQGGAGSIPVRAPAIVRGDDPMLARVADEAGSSWSGILGVEPSRFVVRADARATDLDRIVAELARSKTDAVLYLGPSSLSRPLLLAAERASWHPRFFAPGALWGRGLDEMPRAFDAKITLAFPRLPDDLTRAGRIDLDRLRSRHGLSGDHEATQLAVLTAFRLLEEGLRRSGFQPTRAGLIEELGRLEGFETGFSRPLTFGPTRRLGSDGAYLLTLDTSGRQFRPVGWVAAGTRP
jgi:ABC-type branched-subunit amino acid transport system substrate-binding protein